MPPSFLRMQVKEFNLYDKFNSFNENFVQWYNSLYLLLIISPCLLVKVGRGIKQDFIFFLTAIM